ncbi:MAG: ABC transporter ATP-binding protein [Ignavibacteriae bacterium]|nr:ABC transporter ATP-binding protein [Ignavibacteriota bacterium]
MTELIKVNNLSKYFTEGNGLFAGNGRMLKAVKAVEDVSFSIKKGETLGLVGESGCGKTTLGRCIIRLIEADKGEIFFKNSDIRKYGRKDIKSIRKQMQIIFQDPFSTLNPQITIGSMLKEILRYHGIAKKRESEKAVELLNAAGLGIRHLKRYPHEFSGGQRQRIAIARALATEPEFIVCDEPVSALDVSIQSQIINLLKDTQEKFNITFLFISHDLSVVKHISDNVCVMYLGGIVEYGKSHELFSNPAHPYTQALISAIPKPDPKSGNNKILLKGDIPPATEIPGGCPYNTRCQFVFNKCRTEKPVLKKTGNVHCACHLGD